MTFFAYIAIGILHKRQNENYLQNEFLFTNTLKSPLIEQMQRVAILINYFSFLEIN